MITTDRVAFWSKSNAYFSQDVEYEGMSPFENGSSSLYCLYTGNNIVSDDWWSVGCKYCDQCQLIFSTPG